MVLNCQLFLASPCRCSHDTRFEAADGGNVICHCVSIAAMSLLTHISLVMLHYHCYSGLVYGSTDQTYIYYYVRLVDAA